MNIHITDFMSSKELAEFYNKYPEDFNENKNRIRMAKIISKFDFNLLSLYELFEIYDTYHKRFQKHQKRLKKLRECLSKDFEVK